MQKRTVWVAALIVLVLCANAFAAGSSPNRRRPPTIKLVYKGEVVQKARPYTFCWSYEDDDSGGGLCADGFMRFPRAIQISAPSKLVIRIPYPTKPKDWFVRAYRGIIRREVRDEPVGPGQDIPFRYSAHRVDGKTRAWRLIFRLEEPLRHYYIDTGGVLAQGDAYYTLHARSS